VKTEHLYLGRMNDLFFTSTRLFVLDERTAR
jgi:hypothetical protein